MDLLYKIQLKNWLILLAPSFLYILFSDIFKYKVVSLHLILVTTVITLLFTLHIVLQLSFGIRLRNILGTTLNSIYLIFFIFFYAFNLVSIYFWGENMTYSLTMDYLFNLNEVIEFIPASRGVKIFLLGFLGVLILIIIRISYFISTAWFKYNKISKVKNLIHCLLPIVTIVSILLLSASILETVNKNHFDINKTIYLGVTLILLIVFMIFQYLSGKRGNAKPISRIDRRYFLMSVGALLVILIMQMGVWHVATIGIKENKMVREPIWSFWNDASVVGAGINLRRLQIQESDKSFKANWKPRELNGKAPNIIIILVDALRADHTGLYGYERNVTPFLDSLYYNRIVSRVDLALSTCSNSYCGILSILGSKPFRDIATSNYKIQDYLKDLNYTNHFMLSGSHQNWYNLGKAYGKNIDNMKFHSNTKYSQNDDRNIINSLEILEDWNGEPNFFYIHLMSAHLNGFRRKDLARFKPYRFSFKKNPLDVDDRIEINRYDNGIIQADNYIKEIFEILSRKQYLNNSLVIITSDHGEELGETNKRGHGWNLQPHETIIPMLIYNSNSDSTFNYPFATHVDIGPTIVDRIGAEIPDVWWGASIDSLKTDNVNRFTYHEISKYPLDKAVVWWRKDKVLKYLRSEDPNRTELVFDLITDPYETRNIIDEISNGELNTLTLKMNKHWGSE